MKYKKCLTLLCMVFSFAAVAGCGTLEKAKDSAITEEKGSSDTSKHVTFYTKIIRRLTRFIGVNALFGDC